MAKLFLVGTPIGNLEDITIRALRAILTSKIILAEDTRVFSKLKGLLKARYLEILDALEIAYETDQIISSYRDQNHDRVIEHILKLLTDGNDVTLVSDAGMPGISDPGFKLVRDVLRSGIPVEVIPGPTAVDTALLLSGMPTDSFTFLGFVPRQKSKIQKLITQYSELKTTIIFYESPYRIKKTLSVIREIVGSDTQVALCGEMTKKFETVYRGDISKIIEQTKKVTFKGEWVICLRK